MHENYYRVYLRAYTLISQRTVIDVTQFTCKEDLWITASAYLSVANKELITSEAIFDQMMEQAFEK